MAIRGQDIPDRYKGRKIYSISRLQTFSNCRYAYYLQYILMKDGKDNIYSLLGGYVHELLEYLQTGRMTIAEALEKFDKVLLKTELMDIHFPSDKIRQNFTECIRHFLTNYKPLNVRKFTLEKEFFVEIMGHVVRGFIDCVIENHDDTIEVIDYKTSTKYKASDLDEHARQLILYAYALEELYGIKVSKIKWNMLKYLWLEFLWKGKPKKVFAQRNQWVKEIQNYIRETLVLKGYESFWIESSVETAVNTNSIDLLPAVVQDMFKLSDGYVEYEYKPSAVVKLMEYIDDSVKEIESLPLLEEQWTAREITLKDNFFCSNLCSHSTLCGTYKCFCRDNADSFTGKQDNLMKNLFG